MSIAQLALAALLAAVPASSPADEAVRLYDQGKYGEACVTLRKLDAQGSLSGPLLYRLFFCERAAGNEAAARQALSKSREALEMANVEGAPLEIPFYLANAYANSGRTVDARRVAEEATKALEAGKRAQPSGVIEAFQAGKLYQDQARPDEALAWYAKAIEGFDPASGLYAGSVRWALRYTATTALARGDFERAEAALLKLTGLGGAEAADWSSLAQARARLKKYEAANDAWRQAVQADPANADDPRYAARVALVSSWMPSLPTSSGEGKSFTAMTREELEAAMKAEAEAVREVQGRGAAILKPDAEGRATVGIDPKARLGLQGELDAIKGRFFAAALEYALRGAPIRETAFREGYAVLIFQDREWELPPDPV